MGDNNNPNTNNNNKNDHRALYKRTSISRTPEELHRRRVAINESLRKKHREQLITAKRYRHLTRREEQQSAGESEPEDNERNEHDEDIDPYYRLTPSQVQAMAKDLKSSDKKVRVDAVQSLGKFVLEPAQALIDYITQGDCIETLTSMLSGTEPDEQMQAIQTISNIAAGPYNLWIKSISTVPYLILFLDSDNMNLRELAAGALGNMAAEDLGDMTDEDDEVRQMIRNNGAIKPLVKMLDSNDPRLVQSACFALANLARGPEGQLQDFMAAGISKKLLRHLVDETADTITEICWVTSYLTAGSEQFRQEIMQEGFASPLVKDLEMLADKGPEVLPVLRTLGNLAAGPDEYIELLMQQDQFISTVVKLTYSERSQHPDVIQAVEDANAVPHLTDLVSHSAYDIRKGAAFCLMNIAAYGERHMQSLPHRELLPAFLDLIRSQDAELIKVGLSYVELLLTRVNKGKEILDNTPSCMTALASVTPAPDPEMYAFANKLVDQYYGETPGMEV
ncbi:hypothetical protein EC973_002862 [Apophysomyces ossiformis]|uniref:Importin subunit alpha n=1 Tax=Apophysomyces ossiformis TaxID=679940 RepID=A0A8H7BHU7_9FUNG|nr:hypothetical protein EC973_002862 [Apophysomyces ossiformis]